MVEDDTTTGASTADVVESPGDWRLERSEGLSLWLEIPVGASCNRFARVDVTETEDVVELQAMLETEAGPDVVCADMIQFETVEVMLEAPLADRDLIGCNLDGEHAHYAKHGVSRDTCSDTG